MRVVVIGSGIAGLTCALRAARRHDVTVVTKGAADAGSTSLAQGGIAAALGPDDAPGLHAADTLRAAAGTADPAAVAALTAEGPVRVRELIALGVPFDRDGSDLARGTEAAHSRARVLHADGDATGRAIEDTLLGAVRAAGVEIRTGTALVDLVVRDGRARGADLLGPAGLERVDADAVVLATGGAGRLYAHTTNAPGATGDGIAAALRAGALVTDLEFQQFHPTALAVPGTPLISEAVRGEGAVLRDREGRRFLADVHPDAELAPRDVVARAIADAMARQDGEPVLLDATAIGAALATRFPGLTRLTREHGYDWTREAVPVVPAAHYGMGGVLTDLDGRTSLPGLWAVGECARTGVHGANRLASNSLLEGAVFAARAAEALAGPELPGPVPRSRVLTLPVADDALSLPAAGAVLPTAALQESMWRHAGLRRDADGLGTVLRTLLSTGPEPLGGIAGTEARALHTVAIAVVAAALARTESRGAHHRDDHPAMDARLAHPILWRQPGAATREHPAPAARPERTVAA